MIRRADAISTQVIHDQREITVSGRIIGDWATVSGRVLLVLVNGDAEVEIT
jgi:hypothetical protein